MTDIGKGRPLSRLRRDRVFSQLVDSVEALLKAARDKSGLADVPIKPLVEKEL